MFRPDMIRVEPISSRDRGMAVRAAMILAFVLVLNAVGAASPAESREYGVALRFFQDGKYDLAERELAEFIKKHGGSENLPEAVILLAQSRYQQKQFESAVLLLREQMANAGGLADQYRYWMAESLFQLGNYADAARTFTQMLAEFPASARRLEASVGEAFASYRLGDLKRTLELLRNPTGAFQQASLDRPDDEPAVRGNLLLAEVALSLNDLAAGEEALGRMSHQTLPPELSWQRQYLLGRVQLRREQLDAALGTATGLLTQLDSITNAASAGLRPDVVALQGRIQELKGNTEAAIRAYGQNLEAAVLLEQRQQAAQRIVELMLAQDTLTAAATELEPVVTRGAADPTLDALRLALGELRLKAYYQLPEPARSTDTNLLRLARSHFDQVVANTNATLAARAQLDRGWSLWEEAIGQNDTNRLREGLLAFEAAAGSSPRDRIQAVARFKAGDALFRLGNPPGAMDHYRAVITNYTDLTAVQDGLAPHALYQLARAGIAAGDLETAEQAVARVLTNYPASAFADRSAMLFGEAETRLGKPAVARVFFSSFLERFPESTLAPEIRLAIARTHEQENAWLEAVREYDQWVTHYTNHSALPSAEFNRAWAHGMAGNETNAFNLFTNYVTRFPSLPLTALAQSWIADYHFRHEQYDLAEGDFQRIFLSTNWPSGTLSHQARLMAARAAFRRQGYTAAIGYLTNLINSADCPPALLPEAYFALADTFMSYSDTSSGTATNSLDNYKQAVVVLEKIVANYPTNRLAPVAWGQMGVCYLQRASAEPAFYQAAAAAYTNALTSDIAEVATRSQAEIGLALVDEKLAETASTTERTNLLNQALGRYLNVVQGQNLRDGETAAPFWVKKAAVAAAKLAEELQQWEVAANLYRRLNTLVPGLAQTWDARLARLQQVRDGSKTPVPGSGK